MNSTLQKAFDKLEHQRQQLVELIKNLPEEDYAYAPAAKWSIARIVAHLITSEVLSVGYMKKKSLGIEKLQNSGLRQAILSRMLTISQRGPFRFKAPGIVVASTPEALSLKEALARWDQSRDELKQFLETITDQHHRKLVYKHPIAGMLNAEQAVRFMYEHVNHHLPQIKRLLNR